MSQDTRSKIIIITVVVIVLIIAYCAYLFRFHKNSQLVHPRATSAIIVPFATAKAALWHERIEAIGSIAAMKGITLKAEVPGRITRIFVHAGEHVSKGQKLIQINAKVYQAMVNTTKAQLDLSEHNFKRMSKLYSDNAVSKSKYDQAFFKRNADKAKYQHALAQLHLTTIHAPFSGRFGLKKVFVGDVVSTGDSLANLQADHELRVDFSIPGRYSKAVNIGDNVVIKTNVYPEKKFKATVYAINTRLTMPTRTLNVRARLQSNQLMPNTFAEVMLYLSHAKPVIVIPQTALIKSINGDYVYKVINGQALQTVVHAGDRRKNVIAIVKGLNDGDTVVNGGQNKFSNGARVTNKGAMSTADESPLLKPNS